MALRLLLMTVSISTASCVFPAGAPPGGRAVSEVHSAAGERTLRIEERSSPLRATAWIPILQPPDVFSAYVPSHVDRERDVLIGEHWIFLKLSDSTWFVEDAPGLRPPSSGPARDSDLLRLRAARPEQGSNLLVPLREGPAREER